MRSTSERGYEKDLDASLAHPRRNLFGGAGRAGQCSVPPSLCRALGRGVTSSSDGQRFRAGGKADSTGHINPKYGAEPGRLFYCRAALKDETLSVFVFSHLSFL